MFGQDIAILFAILFISGIVLQLALMRNWSKQTNKVLPYLKDFGPIVQKFFNKKSWFKAKANPELDDKALLAELDILLPDVSASEPEKDNSLNDSRLFLSVDHFKLEPQSDYDVTEITVHGAREKDKQLP